MSATRHLPAPPTAPWSPIPPAPCAPCSSGCSTATPGKARAMGAHPQVDLLGAYEAGLRRAGQGPGQSRLRRPALVRRPGGVPGRPGGGGGLRRGAEGRCVDLALQAVEAGKHIWYDKPAGDWPAFQQVVESARRQGLHLQMGYMLRYHAALPPDRAGPAAGSWATSTPCAGTCPPYSPDATRKRQRYPGGIAFQFASHMIDPTLTLFGSRPLRVTSFCATTPPRCPRARRQHPGGAGVRAGPGGDRHRRHGGPPPPGASRSTAPGAAPSSWSPSSQAPPSASAWSSPARGSRRASSGSSRPPPPRQEAYVHELNAFVGTLTGRQAPDRTLDHELQVEETLHRAVGTIAP